MHKLCLSTNISKKLKKIKTDATVLLKLDKAIMKSQTELYYSEDAGNSQFLRKVSNVFVFIIQLQISDS